MNQMIVAISPQGDRIAYGADNALYIRPIGELDATRIESTEGLSPTDMVFSPDGLWLAFWSQPEQRLMKVAMAGGSPVPVTSISGDPRRPVWTEDDQIIYWQASQFLSVPASGGEEPVVIHEGDGDSGNLLPGGKYLLFNRTGNILIADLETHEEHELFSGGIHPRYVETGHILYFDGQAGSLLARTFDQDTLTVGGPVSVIDGIYQAEAPTDPLFDISSSGTLAYIPGESVGLSRLATLAIVDLEGNIVASLDVPERNYEHPSISPDGLRLAVQVIDGDGSSDIYLYNLSGQSEMRPFITEGNINRQPFWKNETTLLYVSDRDGRFRVYEQSIDGGAAVPLTDPEEDEEHFLPVVTPGAEGVLTFATSNASSGAAEILQMPSGDELRPLVNHLPAQAAASFSLRGDAMAYMGATGNSVGIYVARYPPEVTPYHPDDSGLLGSDEGQFGMYPLWTQPDEAGGNQTLLYQMPFSSSIRAVDVEMPAILFSNRRTVTRFAGDIGSVNMAVIPGTNQLVVVRPPAGAEELQSDAAGPPDRILVTQNWFEVLKQRAPSD
jgi:hypothetical protein